MAKAALNADITKHTLKLDADELLPEKLEQLAGGVQQALADGVLRSIQLGQTALTGRAGLPLGAPPRVGAQAHATDPLHATDPRHRLGPRVYSKLEHHGQLSLSAEPCNPRGVNALCLALHRGPGVLFADLTDCAIGDSGAKAICVALCSANAPPLREVRLGGTMHVGQCASASECMLPPNACRCGWEATCSATTARIRSPRRCGATRS